MHIMVSNNTPDNHSAFVNLVMKAGELEWIFPFILNIKSPEINVSTSLLSTQNEDRIWRPGEEATLSFVVSNIGSGNMNYPIGFDIEMDENIAINLNNDYHLEEMSFEDIEPVFLNFLSMNDIPLGTQLFLDIQLFELGCESQCRQLPNLNLHFTVGNSNILLWNPSSNSQSSFKLASYFMSQGYGSFDHINSTYLPDLSTYHTAFIFLGVHPNNYHLTQADAHFLENILLRGGNIYLEGGDTWFFNESTTLHSYFNIEGISDGSSDLSQIVGGQNTFAEQMTFQYSGESNWIDRLQPIGSAQTLLSNVSPQYSTAIIYEDYTGYKTIGASHELRGLEGEFFDDYLTELISFFDFDSQPICSSGDLNNDILVNVLDVVRLVSIVLGNGPQESTQELCASDLNGDNLFNIMDVVMLVQIVLNSNL